MKAVAYDRYGPPEVLRLVDRGQPAFGPDDLLVATSAAGVNPADWRLRSGQFRFGMRLELPFVPGSDIAGFVVAAGANVDGFAVGDAVHAMTPLKAGGGYAEFVSIPSRLAALAPTGLPIQEAAALPLAGLTALQALRDGAGLRAGQRLAVIGASGGVGHLAVQVGRAMGATVTGVCGARRTAFVRDLGADATLDPADAASDAPTDRFDVVFDAVAKAPFTRFARLLRPGGTLVTVNPVVGRILPPIVTRLFGVARLRSVFVTPSGADLETLGRMVATGKVRPHIERHYALADAVQAQRVSEEGHVLGKLVIDVREG